MALPIVTHDHALSSVERITRQTKCRHALGRLLTEATLRRRMRSHVATMTRAFVPWGKGERP